MVRGWLKLLSWILALLTFEFSVFDRFGLGLGIGELVVLIALAVAKI